MRVAERPLLLISRISRKSRTILASISLQIADFILDLREILYESDSSNSSTDSKSFYPQVS